MHFLAKNAFWEKKSTFWCKIALLWSRRLQRRNSARGMWVRAFSKWHFLSENHNFAKMVPRGPKGAKTHFLHFWAQKWKITQKVHLGAKGVKFHPNSIGKTRIRGQMQNRDILSIYFSQQRNSANCEFHLGSFYHFANKNGIWALSTMSEFSTQLQKKLWPLCPKSTRGEKGGRGAHFVPLGIKIGILGQKCSFGGFGCHLRSTGLFLKDYWWFWGAPFAFFDILHQNHGNAPLECIFRFFAQVDDLLAILCLFLSPRVQKSRKCYHFCFKSMLQMASGRKVQKSTLCGIFEC